MKKINNFLKLFLISLFLLIGSTKVIYSSNKEVPLTSLAVTNVIAIREGVPTIKIIMSKDISNTFDPTAYVKIFPPVKLKINKSENNIILKGDFNLKRKYTITVLKGIKAKDNTMLEQKSKHKVKFTLLESKLDFATEGVILPSSSDKKINFRSVNVNKVNVTIRKIYNNNTTQFLQENGLNNKKKYSSYEYDNLLRNTSDIIFSKEYSLKSSTDKWIQTSLDLNGIIEGNNLYQITITFDEKGSSYILPEKLYPYQKRDFFRKNGKIEKLLLFSDLALIGEISKTKISLKVMNILTNTPVTGAKVKLFSKTNQLLQEKISDSNGNAEFDKINNYLYVVSEHLDSRAILEFRVPIQKDGFDTGGKLPTKELETFIYTERGVYRPGDKIYISSIVRNNNKALENNHPITLNVYTPTGSKYLSNQVLKTGKNGFYSYTLQTKSTDETGIWRLESIVGDKRSSINISVETIVPYTLKNKISLSEEINISENLNMNIQSNYLFGAPAAGNKYSVEFFFSEPIVKFDKYKNYNFKNITSYSPNNNYFKQGVLDQNGKATVTLTTEELKKINSQSLNLIGNVVTKVLEDSGRPVISKSFTTIKKFNNYLGIETGDYLKAGEPLNLNIITPTIDGTSLVPNRKLVYRIYQHSYSWWMDYNNHSQFIKSIKSDKNTKLLIEKRFTSKKKPYLITNKIKEEGNLYIEVEDLETKQISSTSMYISEWGNTNTQNRIETLELKSDKTKYSPGESAKIAFNGVKNGKVIIAIEKKGEIIKRIIRDTKDKKFEEIIPLDSTMAPNIYIHVLLLQDYNLKDNDRPLRLYGVLPISVVDEKTKLNLSIDSPNTIRPKEKFKIKINNASKSQMEYTISVVDIGLLDLTAFQTPNPWNFFYKKIASTINFYDNYSIIIDKPFGKIHQVLKTGGDILMENMMRSSRQKKLGIENVERFTPISLYSGVLTSDINGSGEFEFEMPNYMGAVKVMVVAADKSAFGSIDKDIIVKAPIITQASLPRTLKIGDKFTTPVNIFALEDNIGEVQIDFIFNGKKQSKKITPKKNIKQTIYFDEIVGDSIGKAVININTTSSTFKNSEKIEIAVNSNNLPISISKNKVLSNNETTVFSQEKNYIKGSVSSYITLSNMPLLGIDQRLEYLIKYPYGCLEQTISSILPQLFIEQLMTKKNYNSQNIVKNVNDGISRLRNFQFQNGSFAYWPGQNHSDLWATNYAGHFLILAKNNGFYIPDDMYQKWINFTKSNVKTTTSSNRDNKIYGLYLLALAGEPEISELNYIYSNRRKELNGQETLYLAAAFSKIGEKNIAISILKDVDISYIQKEKKNSRYSYSELKELGIYLDCYYSIYGVINTEVYNEIIGMLQSTKWYSTQSIGYSLIPLSHIVSKGLDKEIKGTIDIDGVVTKFKTIKDTQIKILPKSNSIKIKNTSNIPLYLNYYWEGVPKNSNIESFNHTLTLKREFYDNKGLVIDPTNLMSGSTFWIKLSVGQPTYFPIDNIALNQGLPSGWEVENLRLTKTPIPQWVQNQTVGDISYLDLRDDRALVFFDLNNNRGKTIFFKINTTTQGNFQLPGTFVEAMYDNKYKAYLKGFKVNIK